MSSIQEFCFDRDGVLEPVAPAEWGWIAIYRDGSALHQYDTSDGRFHQVREIKQHELDTFIVQHASDENRRIEIHWNPGMELIFFYRNWRSEEMPSGEWVKVTCFGYKQRVSTIKTVKTILELHPNGAIALRDDDDRND